MNGGRFPELVATRKEIAADLCRPLVYTPRHVAKNLYVSYGKVFVAWFHRERISGTTGRNHWVVSIERDGMPVLQPGGTRVHFLEVTAPTRRALVEQFSKLMWAIAHGKAE